MEWYTGGLTDNFHLVLFKIKRAMLIAYNLQFGLGNWVENGDI